MNCPGCHKEIEARWKACPYCLQELKKTSHCPGCQAELQELWLVCPFCLTPTSRNLLPADRASLIATIENYLKYAQLELAEQELSNLAAILIEQGDPTRDQNYQRLQRAIAEAKKRCPTHICPVTGMELIEVYGGEFQMGDDFWGVLLDCCKPARRVEVAPFLLGKYQVTQGQWQQVMGGDNPALYCGEEFMGWNKPVINISWDDAGEFIARLNRKADCKLPYRLATEAEWEYAARARGGRHKWSGTSRESALENYAWYEECSNGCISAVGRKRPNELGLYDMSGNVWEWCADVWHDNYDGAPGDAAAWISGGDGARRVVRGGSWGFASCFCWAAHRTSFVQGEGNDQIGFRVAMDCR